MKPTFEWTPEISVGENHIDAQHKELLSQVNMLLEVMMGKKDISTIREVISFLDDYIYEHFSYEEGYMSEHAYPNTEQHIQIHRSFMKQYESLKERFEKQGLSEELLFDVEKYLGSWWIQHIGVEDKKYAMWIRNQNTIKKPASE